MFERTPLHLAKDHCDNGAIPWNIGVVDRNGDSLKSDVRLRLNFHEPIQEL